MAMSDDSREEGEEEGQADVLLEEEWKGAGCSGEGVAEGAVGCALEQEEGDEDAEDAVAVVDRVRIDAVDAKHGEGRGEEGGGGPRVIRGCGEGCAR